MNEQKYNKLKLIRRDELMQKQPQAVVVATKRVGGKKSVFLNPRYYNVKLRCSFVEQLKLN